MDTVDFARVVAEFGVGNALLVEPGAPAATQVPAKWAGVVVGDEPRARRAAATALWTLDMLMLLPRFAAALDECLDDVRVCLLRGDWVLLYAFRKPFQAHEFRIGWEPETFGPDLPPHWDSLPTALRNFLRTVHAGFTDLDGISFGPTRPRDMRTYRALSLEEPVRNWEADQDIPGDRMTLVTQGMGGTRYFVSPNLPGGTIGWEFGGNLDKPLEFDETLDELMSKGFQLERDRAAEPEKPPEDPRRTLSRVRSMRAARAVVWSSELTEEIARARIRGLVAELLRALGGQFRVRPQDGPDGEMILPCDDGAGAMYDLDRLEVNYFLDQPWPDPPDIYPSVIMRIWEQLGWPVTPATDPYGIVAQARTADWYELTLALRHDVLRLAVTSPGFVRSPA
ncbi:hypothetical protein [Nocardia pseudobrasiliensis]|uniref:Uncharacterized protein n=1 Tax=Nocardia pseudobrasiliensis TaxID=45979 RepID=A0A370I390_9NOCA|nr:hypothetical protein [Nocardia pseudobrasiliensis]RDI65050.1 hypothetical protein DFR76_107428 [Nocardia pseudobrasiliensis]